MNIEQRGRPIAWEARFARLSEPFSEGATRVECVPAESACECDGLHIFASLSVEAAGRLRAAD